MIRGQLRKRIAPRPVSFGALFDTPDRCDDDQSICLLRLSR